MDRTISQNARWTSGILTSIWQYMMNRKEWYVSFVKITSKTKTFVLAFTWWHNTYGWSLKGHRCVKIQLTTDKKFRLKNVLCIPRLGRNFLSVNQIELRSSHVEVLFTAGKCMVKMLMYLLHNGPLIFCVYHLCYMCTVCYKHTQ